jgi:hypothetical protein
VDKLDVRAWTDEDHERWGLSRSQAGTLLAAGWSKTMVDFCAWVYRHLDINSSGVVEEADYDLYAEREAWDARTDTLSAKQQFCAYRSVYAFPTSRLLHIEPAARGQGSEQDHVITFESWLYFLAGTCSAQPENLLNLIHAHLRVFSLHHYCYGPRHRVTRDRRERAVLLFHLVQRGVIEAKGTEASEPVLLSSFPAGAPVPAVAFESNVVCVRADEFITADMVPRDIIDADVLVSTAAKNILHRTGRAALEDGDYEGGKLKVFLPDWEHCLKLSGVLTAHTDTRKKAAAEVYWNNICNKYKV